jgi:AcrR family transcriptional regulator
MFLLSTYFWHTGLVAVKKPYHHGNLRDVLLTASLDLIREAGVQQFTLREVARRAGVSHAAPYRHFQDKAELLAAIAEQGFDRLTDAMHSAAVKSRDPFERLQNAGLAYIEFAQQHPQHFLVMFTVDLNEELYPSAKAAAKRSYSELLSLVSACESARSTETVRPETIALIAWSQVHGIAELFLRGQLGFRTGKELRQFAKLATDVFGSGARLKKPDLQAAQRTSRMQAL